MLSHFVTNQSTGRTRLMQAPTVEQLLSKAAPKLGERVDGKWVPASKLRINGIYYENIDGRWRAVEVG